MLGRFVAKIQIKYFSENIYLEKQSDVNNEKDFLSSFKTPTNDFKRTYYQHCCQMRKVPLFIILCSNIISFFALPILILTIFIKQVIRKSKSTKSCGVVYLDCFNGSINYPVEIEEEFLDFIEVGFYEGQALCFKDILFVFRFLMVNPFSYWLAVRLLYRIGVYRYLIKTYNPKAIVVTSELAPTASALTYYCEENGLEHINIMHGERMYGVKASFFRFSRFYVWDNYYAELFKSLRAVESQFIVYSSNMLFINIADKRRENEVVDYTYYLANNSEEELRRIGALASKFKEAGFSIRLRPHFRWTNMELLRKYASEDIIEDYTDFSIEDSIASTNAAISVCSTVLLQSVLSGRDVYLDDIVFKERVEVLENRAYIVCNKKHGRLSELDFLVEGINNN